MSLPIRPLAGRDVSAIGFGCMNLSHAYGKPATPEQGRLMLHAALDAGVTMFDTAALYGFGANESLVGRVLAPHRRDILLCSKGGLAGESFPEGLKRVIDGRPAALRRHCEESLKRLGTDHIDLYYLHRWDKAVPIEESVGEMARLKAEGKIGALGLSEVSATTLRKAHAEHPIAAVQSEYSLWARNVEIAVLKTCRELGAAFVAFSPLARGVLTSARPDPENFEPKDIRRAMPRFEPNNYVGNLRLAHRHDLLAAQAGCSSAQLALAWLLHQGDHVLPLPGTTQVPHLLENLGALPVTLGDDMIRRLDELWQPSEPVGARYNAQSSREVDTEEFPS
jgi:aryl-alcohol dehydrogenase-like predicted oxidoreductase